MKCVDIKENSSFFFLILFQIKSFTYGNLTNDFRTIKKKTLELLNELKRENTSQDVKDQYLDQINVSFK
jgi:hypothetical protein